MCFYEKEKFKDTVFFFTIVVIASALITLIWWMVE